jgi:23S rRNA pseudouridine1911/1915/1917 synthase
MRARPRTKPQRKSERPLPAGALLLRVDAARAGQTLAALVRAALDGLPWNQARALCRRGKVRVNGEIETDGSRLLAERDLVALEPHAPRLHAHVLDDSAIVHCDHHVVVVNKPSGLLTVPFDESDKNTLVDRLRFSLQRKHGARGAELGVVQRLDKDTSGVLVFARTLSAKRELQQQLRVHSIERSYLALVHGAYAGSRTIESQLVPNRGDGLRGSWGHKHRPKGPLPKQAQRALTHVRALERLRGATLVECRLETGRQHQIRIHLSEQCHPLLGEPVYIRDHHGPRIAAARPMLHAAVLGFTHPATGQQLRFEQAPPEDFAELLADLRDAGSD